MWSRRFGAVVLLGASVALLGPSTARAEESPETEALLKKGIQLRREGADEAALETFLQAEQRDPDSVRVLLHVATAAQAASKWLMADEYLKKAAQHSDDPYYQRYRQEIEDVRAATAQRVGQISVVGEPSGADIVLNGQPVGTLPMEDPKTIEAGTYVLEVNKPGFYRLRRPVAVPGGVLTRETVQLNPRPANAPDGSDPSAGGAIGVDASSRDLDWWQSPWVTWTLLGIGVAGAATSGTALFLRERTAEDWNDDRLCLDPNNATLTRDQVCEDEKDLIDTTEQVAIIAGVAGAVFTTAAITHWLATPGRPEPGSSAENHVRCSPGLMNLVCSGTF